PDFQILRRYRRPLLLRLEHTHRPTLEDYVHRATRLGSSRSLNLRIGITPFQAKKILSFPSASVHGLPACAGRSAMNTTKMATQISELMAHPLFASVVPSVFLRFGFKLAP